MKALLAFFLFLPSAFCLALDYRWIGTNLYNFDGAHIGTNYMVSGTVEYFEPNGFGNIHCPVAKLNTSTNLVYRFIPAHIYDNRDVLTATYAKTLEGKVASLGQMMTMSYDLQRFLTIERESKPVMILNAPPCATGELLTVWCISFGAQPWQTASGPKTIRTYDCGRLFNSDSELPPDITYALTPKGIKKLTNAVPINVPPVSIPKVSPSPPSKSPAPDHFPTQA